MIIYDNTKLTVHVDSRSSVTFETDFGNLTLNVDTLSYDFSNVNHYEILLEILGDSKPSQLPITILLVRKFNFIASDFLFDIVYKYIKDYLSDLGPLVDVYQRDMDYTMSNYTEKPDITDYIVDISDILLYKITEEIISINDFMYQIDLYNIDKDYLFVKYACDLREYLSDNYYMEIEDVRR